jgi:hypothetical protein
MDKEQLREFLATQDVPAEFRFRDDGADGSVSVEPARVRGTLQAGSEEGIHLLTGSTVLQIPVERMIGIRSTSDVTPRTVEVLVSADAAIEGRMQFLALPNRDPAFPPVLGKPPIDYTIFDDPRLERDKELLEQLRKIGVPIPPAIDGADGGTVSYSYLSSATTRPDAGTDSDPIRTADD